MKLDQKTDRLFREEFLEGINYIKLCMYLCKSTYICKCANVLNHSVLGADNETNTLSNTESPADRAAVPVQPLSEAVPDRAPAS